MLYSQAAVDLIRRFEGLQFTTYRDSGGLKTIGWGHREPEDSPDRTITEAEASALLAHDLTNVRIALNHYLKIAPYQYEFDALCDFVYNIGSGAFKESTMLELINRYMCIQAANEFDRWVRDAKGEIMPGLVARRRAEKALFLHQAEADTHMEEPVKETT